MSTDLHSQLAEYGRYQRSKRRPVELSDVQAVTDATRAPAVHSPNHTTKFDPDEGDLIMIDVQTGEDLQTGETVTARTNRRSWQRLAMLSAAAAIILIGGVALFNRTGDSNETNVVDAANDVFGPESSLAVVDDYFAAHDVGDIDSVFALFTSDATYSDTWSAPMDRTDWEPRFAWDLAQGETLVSPDCSVVDEVPESTVTISCTFGTLDAIGLAVDAVEIPTTAEMTVTPDGISNLRENFGSPDFKATGVPFDFWMTRNHSEDAEAAGCCQADTVEESVARGELRAKYAAEWAAYIKANDCNYTVTGCDRQRD